MPIEELEAKLHRAQLRSFRIKELVNQRLNLLILDGSIDEEVDLERIRKSAIDQGVQLITEPFESVFNESWQRADNSSIHLLTTGTELRLGPSRPSEVVNDALTDYPSATPFCVNSIYVAFKCDDGEIWMFGCRDHKAKSGSSLELTDYVKDVLIANN